MPSRYVGLAVAGAGATVTLLGDLLYEMMNPMTICLGFRMYASRRTIYANLKAILVGTGWAAATALSDAQGLLFQPPQPTPFGQYFHYIE